MGGDNYHELLEEQAAKNPDKIWLLFEDERVSFSEADADSNRMAHGLIKLGVGRGDGVATMMINSPEYMFTLFATQKIGAYIVPVNTELKGEHLAYILNHSESKVLVIHHELLPAWEKIKPDVPGIKKLVVGLRDAEGKVDLPEGAVTIESILGTESATRPDTHHGPGEMALLLYTSGTTGRAKGVIYKYDKIGVRNVALLAMAIYNKGNDVHYTCLPLFHANALFVSTPSTLATATPFALGRRFSASRFWDDIRRYGATTFHALGAMIPILMKQPEKPNDADNPVRMVLSAACPANIWEAFEKRFGLKIWEFYGAVDGGGFAIFNMGNAPIGSIGKLPPGTGRVVDDQMSDCPPRAPGELIFKVDDKKVQYFKNDDATNEKIHDGYLWTGDLVYKDENDFLYFVDRAKDNMRRRGENISSFEVEQIVQKFPSVLEAAAFGVPADLGEDDVMVAVLARPGETVDPVKLYEFCQENMPRYMVPRYIEVMTEFPKTETHRVIKPELKRRGVTEKTWDEEKEIGRRKKIS